ncbi:MULTISPECIES: heme exporter protein CcmD [unclassified Stenotrophomonas]|uniref:heme exporter protein CcmD n=1 Tax=unclassified Stenotrophomonas TaxID=196198 RepID=UPI0025F967C5|nr:MULTISPECIES: heme exporter protein CcmD [unclassified Stenotrophomonas]
MSYFKYVAMAYAVFFIVLAWDFIVPRMQIRRQLRDARGRIARDKRAKAAPSDEELSR